MAKQKTQKSQDTRLLISMLRFDQLLVSARLGTAVEEGWERIGWSDSM
jgi:hypothetical protein